MILSENDPGYQRCSLSVLDNIADPAIRFDGAGISNYYHAYKKAEAVVPFLAPDAEQQLDQVVSKIKKAAGKDRFDSIMGVSGGVDSTYMAYQAKKLGLNPLVVHFDNGWNSELAVKNIENIVSKLGFELFTLVVDWNEFKDIQLAYLKASVVDIEAITDHAIIATLYKLAAEHGIRYILSGTNIVTEFVLPSYWIWNKYDSKNIKAIHQQYGSVPLKTYPFLSMQQRHYYQRVKKIETVAILNYMPYRKTEVKDTIIRELGWRDYGGKHYESIFTRFYQGHILPQKFHIDKRKAHLSNLVFSGQMSREEALQELHTAPYAGEQFRTDFDFVLKKFNLTEAEWNSIMAQPRREHAAFDHDKRTVWEQYPYLKPLRGVWRRLSAVNG